MAEDTVKRVTGINPLFPAITDMSPIGMPFAGSPSDTADAAVPALPEDPRHFFQPTHEQILNSGMHEIASAPIVKDDQNPSSKTS